MWERGPTDVRMGSRRTDAVARSKGSAEKRIAARAGASLLLSFERLRQPGGSTQTRPPSCNNPVPTGQTSSGLLSRTRTVRGLARVGAAQRRSTYAGSRAALFPQARQAVSDKSSARGQVLRIVSSHASRGPRDDAPLGLISHMLTPIPQTHRSFPRPFYHSTTNSCSSSSKRPPFRRSFGQYARPHVRSPQLRGPRSRLRCRPSPRRPECVRGYHARPIRSNYHHAAAHQQPTRTTRCGATGSGRRVVLRRAALFGSDGCHRVRWNPLRSTAVCVSYFWAPTKLESRADATAKVTERIGLVPSVFQSDSGKRRHTRGLDSW